MESASRRGRMNPYGSRGSGLGYRGDIDELTAVAALGEEDGAVNKSVESVVLAHAYVEAGVVDCAALTLDDVAGLAGLTTENLDAEALALRLTSVLRTTYTFFVCHDSAVLRGLSNDFLDGNLGEALAMAVFAAIALAALFLENNHFLAFDEGGLNFADNFGAFNSGGADFNVTVGVEQENTVKFDGVAFLDIAKVVNVQELTGLGLELLSLDFNNCVHCYVTEN